MKQTRSYAYSIILLFISLTSYSQTFPCDGTLLISSNQGASPQLLFQVLFGPFGTVFFNPIARYGGAHFNSLGFNARDNFIYAVKANSNEIVRLKSDDTFEVVGSVLQVPTLSTSAGDCSPEGHFLFIDNELNQLFVFEVMNGFNLISQVDLTWDANSSYSGSFTARVDDFAIDPTNPTVAYAFQGDYFNPDLEPFETRGSLLRINIDIKDNNIGKVLPIGRVPADEIRQFGSLMFTPDGVLHGYGSKSPGPNLMQNTILQIDKNSGRTSKLIGIGPNALSTDGCSCPYALTFENDVNPRDALCTDSELTYTLTINNRFFDPVDGVILKDTLPEGMMIEEVYGDFKGNIDSRTGVGTRILIINDLQIPAQAQTQINIKVRVIDIGINLIGNQAHLLNLPERMGRTLESDDPFTTSYIGDATDFWGVAQTLEDVEMDITHPTDCLDANNGTAALTSPIFIVGEPYTVKLKDEEFNEISREVVVNADHSFLLDSLPPGEYDLFEITPQSTTCSFAMKDATLDIIAPNEQIKADAVSNSPLCEGQVLNLSASMSPEGSISWKGPYDLKSKEPNLTFDSASLQDSGTYTMTARYGGCKQIRTLEVDVAPVIEAEIFASDEYCERDVIELSIETESKFQSIEWIGPNKLNRLTNDVRIAHAESKHEGLYQMVVDNGFCRDTITKWISINESPTIVMDDNIISQFCEPLFFNPVITGATNVSYQWSPSEGLDCSNCAQPELLEPILPIYKLNVSTTDACTDSIIVQVALDAERLIYVPTIFSPNSDGENDYFQVTPGCGLSSIRKFEIVDRWGVSVFYKEQIDYIDVRSFWDGTKNGKLADPGVYLWFMELELLNGKTRSMSGNITLIP